MRRLAGASRLLLILACAGATAMAQERLTSPVFEVPPAIDSRGRGLRWDNLEGWCWVGGVVPRYSLAAGRDLVRLEPGEYTQLLLEPGSVLRVERPDGVLTTADVTASFSSGSGLRAPLRAIPTNDEGSVCFYPHALETTLVELERSAGAEAPVDLALYVSRLAPARALEGFRDVVALPSEAVLVDVPSVPLWQRQPQSRGRWWRLEAANPVMVRVEGPSRVVFRTRLVYPQGEHASAQSYRFGLTLGDRQEKLELLTLVDSRSRFEVNGVPTALGRERYVYFDVPPGEHELHVSFDASVLCRLLRRPADDFLLHPPPRDRGEMSPLLNVSDEALQAPLEWIRDGRYADASLLGALYARTLATRMAAQSQEKTLARSIFERYTQSILLLPRVKSLQDQPLVAQFTTPRLLAPDASARSLFLPETSLHRARAFRRGVFLEIPTGEERGYVYSLPPRSAPSRLQVVVRRRELSESGTFPTRIHVQVDGLPPVVLRLALTAELPLERFRPSTAEGALTALLEEKKVFAPRGLHGALNESRVPVPFVPVAMADLALPQEVETVRLWMEGPAGGTQVALTCLDSVAFRPTELEFESALGLAAGTPVGKNLFLSAVDSWQSQDGADLNVLGDAWVPLLRRVEMGGKRFEMSLGARVERPRPETSDAAAVNAALGAAMVFEQEEEWLCALEAWNRVTMAQDAELRRRARMHRLDALRALGQHFLADRELQALVLSSDDLSLRDAALERLYETYQEAGRTLALRDVLSYLLLKSPSNHIVARLAGNLFDSGRESWALQLAATLPPDEQDLELILGASHRLGWWRHFENALESPPDREVGQYWRGMRHVYDRRHEEALDAFARGGVAGETQRRRLTEALAIREQLRSDDLETRYAALLSWEGWEAAQEGPFRWEDASSGLLDSAGTEWTYDATHDVRQRYEVASTERPVLLEVLGPATLRLDVRPLHGEPVQAVKTWLEVRSDLGLFPVAVSSTAAARGLELLGARVLAPGRSNSHELRLGVGLHRLELRPAGENLLVRARLRQPRTRMGVLPPWTATAFRAALDEFARQEPPSFYRSWVTSFGANEPGTTTRVLAASSLEPAPVRELPPALGEGTAARLALRLGDSDMLSAHAVGLRRIVEGEVEASADERLRACLWLKRIWDDEESLMPCVESLDLTDHSNVAYEAALLALGRFDELLELDTVVEADYERIRHMENLAYVAEKEPRLRRRAVVLGAQLAWAHRDVRALSRLDRRLRSGLVWTRLESVEDSAGLRHIELDRRVPESPGLRARAALLPPIRSHERDIAGTGVLTVSLDNAEPIQLKIDLWVLTSDHSPLQAPRIFWRLDSKAEESLPVSPDGRVEGFAVRVPEGRHAVRLRVDSSTANQTVRVSLAEVEYDHSRSGGELRYIDTETQLGTSARRLYHVATDTMPVVVPVEGPDVIRVDELRDGYTRVSYRYIAAAGWTQLRLTPAPGQAEGLFRVFQLTERPAAPRAGRVPAASDGAPRPPPPMRLTLPSETEPRELLLEDGYSLGGQEDGTFTLGIGLHRRRVFEEDRRRGIDADEFLQLDLQHRYFLEPYQVHFNTGVFARAHDARGPTFGVEEDLHYHPEWLPFTLNLRASAVAQTEDGERLEARGSSEWAGTLRGTISRRFHFTPTLYHVPSFGIFGRYLSLDNDIENDPGSLDIDVFTEYKRDHLKGLVLAESVGYQPWLDTILWTRMSLASNEDLNPGNLDNFGVGAGWRQYVGGLEVDAGYRLTQFFNDRNRSNTSHHDAIFIKGRYDLWPVPGNRVEVSASYRHDLANGEGSGFVSLAWHFGGGRNYRDFWYGDVNFLELRRGRIPPGHNNSIREATRE